MSMRRPWTDAEHATLRARYPDSTLAQLRDALPGRSTSSIYQRARILGLRKSDAYLASEVSGRLRAGDDKGAPFRFSTGHVPANKGLRRPGWAKGRMRETQFQPGVCQGIAAQVVKPIGAERLSADGYLERKVNNDRPFHRRWRAVHLLLWEATHGPVPADCAVVFVNGDKTDIRLDNLALVRRADLMRRNTLHNLPDPLPQLIQLRAALVRKLNRRTPSHAE